MSNLPLHTQQFPTQKQRMQTLLDGGVPVVPPHFELVFQLEKEVFGMDLETIKKQTYPDSITRTEAIQQFNIDLCTHLVNHYDWAAVPALCYAEDVDVVRAITRMKEALGQHALVFSFNGDGVFWMPTGDQIMDFTVMLFERPDELHRQAQIKCRMAKELAKRQVDAGLDFIVMNSDFGYNTGPFVSPAHFQEFVTPYMTEIVGVFLDLNNALS